MAASNLANLPSPPPIGSLQFFDGYFPALVADTYAIALTHALSGNAGAPSFQADQIVIVEAPEFRIDSGILVSIYPPSGSTDMYGQKLPFVVLNDPSLPWERSLVPGQPQPNPASPTAWMALLIFAAGEMILPQGSNNPVSTTTVQLLLTPSDTVLKPQIPPSNIAADVLNSQCQTITIPGLIFNAVVPTTAELPLLTHCRAVNTLDEGEQLFSVLLANRLPQANASPAAPMQYFAHLVSLEGFASYMGPNATPIPKKLNSQELMDVQMVSLYNWSFTSLPATGESFRQLMTGLVASQQASATQQSTVTLQLPLPPNTSAPQPVQDRLNEGFVPLTFVSGSQEESFAWYRGPLTAQVPQPLPEVGNPATALRAATTADELMIYLAEQGMFDLSYAAAWNLGRNLGLADAVFARQVTTYRNAVSSSFATYAQRTSLTHLAGRVPAAELLANNLTQRKFASMVASGMGHSWTKALTSVRLRGEGSLSAAQDTAPVLAASARPASRFARRPMLHPRLAVSSPEAAAAVSTDLNEIVQSVAEWLANLSLLYPVPFSHLVPNPGMLPVESLRFFYVDPAWIDALVAGALSIALHSTADVAQQMAMMPTVKKAIYKYRARSFRRVRPDAAIHPASAAGNVVASANAGGNGISMTGVLIRSAVVSGWPKMVVAATVGGAPLNLVRDDCPSPSVRLCLFDGIPDTVTLSEPYQGVLFGVENQGVYPRCVTAPAFTGSQIANASPVAPAFRTPPSGYLGGVLQVQSLAASIEPVVGITPFATGAVVNFNGTALATTVVNANQLQATVPANLIASPGTAQITVSSGGATSQPQNFIVNAPLEIDSINPVLIEVGVQAFTLTVDGVGFATGATVQWNGSALTTTPISVNQVTAQVPANLVTNPAAVAITVSVGGNTSNPVTLSVVAADPIINSIAPSVAMAGGAGFTLTVFGAAFAQGAVVTWNGNPLTTALVSDQQLKASVPASLIANQGSATVAVTLDGVTSNNSPFTITNASPTIGSIGPSFALAGGGNSFPLTVEGVNFGKNPTVNFGPTSLSPQNPPTPTQVTVMVPANLVSSPGTVNVSVQVGSVASNSLPFLITGPQPAVGLLAPPEIVAGSAQFTLNVYGGFGAGDFALQLVAAPQSQSFPTT